jgi:hypothetical protein
MILIFCGRCILDAIEPNIGALAVFAVAWLVCCTAAFQISGLLPLAEAPQSVRSGSGAALVFLDIALLLLLAVLTLFHCFRELRWSSIIVVGGAIFLFSPFVTQDLPPALKYSKAGLAFLALVLVLALAILVGAGVQLIVLRAFTRT